MPEIILSGPAGRLEGRYHQSKNKHAPIALIMHPHPQFRGTMDNPVTHALYYNFVEHGFSVLRFNFRGVGMSEGEFDNGAGELTDAATALDWLHRTNPDTTGCWIAGFSFGAWISMQLLMRRPEIANFISISPMTSHYDFSFLAPCPASGLFVIGQKDKITPNEDVKKLVTKLDAQKRIKVDYVVVQGANHFFHDKLEPLMEYVNEYILKNVRYTPLPIPPVGRRSSQNRERPQKRQIQQEQNN